MLEVEGLVKNDMAGMGHQFWALGKEWARALNFQLFLAEWASLTVKFFVEITDST